MHDLGDIAHSLQELGFALRPEQSLRARVLSEICERQSRATLPGSNRKNLRYRAACWIGSMAACAALAGILWLYAGNSAQRVFAAAMDGVQNARTFSCKEVSWFKKNPSDVGEATLMFKEPGLERDQRADATGVRITVTDFVNRRSLVLEPGQTKASLQDVQFRYVVNEKTGYLRQIRLNTSIREDLLKLRDNAVQDLGMVELDGQAARLMQSQKGSKTTRVWVQPRTQRLLQIEVENPETYRVYKSIQIDTPLDDNLFSVDPPAGYTLFKGGVYSPWTDRVGKLYAKMRSLVMRCIKYAEKHDGEWPADLSELQDKEFTVEILSRILASPEDPDGPPAIQYQKPAGGSKNQIVLYEVYSSWPSDGIAVTFSDGHSKVIKDQVGFENQLK